MKFLALSGIMLVLLFAAGISPVKILADDWSQDAHDAQRTGSTAEDPGNGSKWSFAWFWQSPANSNPPKEGRSVTGDGKIYLPAGASGLYALNLTNGSQVWHVNGNFNAAPAYNAGFIYAGSDNGNLYKINSTNGSITGTFNAGSPLNKAVLLANGFAYVGTDGGTLYKVDMTNMNSIWQYSAGSKIDTPTAYSARGILVFATDDLYVHGISDTNGSRLWRVKPSPNAPGSLNSRGWNSFNWGWPVIAENHGLVMLRQQLPDANDTGAKLSGPNNGLFGSTNSETRAWLESNPGYQNLFALDLLTGTAKFTPAVGFGSVEMNINNIAVAEMGTQPVVKTWSNGNEVVYMPFRSAQSPCGYDDRWSGDMGEMVLDNTTISGLSAGDLRFVKMNRDCQQGGQSYVYIIDEETPITMAGNALFNAHWGASEGVTITDRSNAKGLSYSNPITTTNLPVIIRRLTGCGSYNATTHRADCGLTLYQDGRYWDGPGWAVYNNTMDPPGPNSSTAYSAGFLPRYTYVSNGYVVVEGNGGDLMVLTHGGTISASPTPTTTTAKTGDANGDGKVDGIDYVVWLNHYNLTSTLGSRDGDFNTDGKVDGVDYVVWLNNYN